MKGRRVYLEVVSSSFYPYASSSLSPAQSPLLLHLMIGQVSLNIRIKAKAKNEAS